MNETRLLLLGESSGMRRIIENICVNKLDMDLLYEPVHKEVSSADDFFAKTSIVSSVKKNKINVVLLDLDGIGDLFIDSTPKINFFATNVAHQLLELFPQLTIVSLASRGKKMKIFADFHLNDVGVNQLINAISLVGSRHNASAHN